MVSYDRALPTVSDSPARQGLSASSRGIPAWSWSGACLSSDPLVQPAAGSGPRSLPPAPGGERRGHQSAGDRGATLPCWSWAGGGATAPGGSGGTRGPAQGATTPARAPPSAPLRLSRCVGSFVLHAAGRRRKWRSRAPPLQRSPFPPSSAGPTTLPTLPPPRRTTPPSPPLGTSSL